jgi:hypothetical protein
MHENMVLAARIRSGTVLAAWVTCAIIVSLKVRDAGPP